MSELLESVAKFPWTMVSAGLVALQIITAVLAPFIAKKLAEQGLVTRRQYELDMALQRSREQRREQKILEEVDKRLQRRLLDLGVAKGGD
jgi:hypothetical protein